MPVEVKFFPAHKNKKFIDKYNDLKRDFIASIPHGLKNSIRYASTYADWLKRGGAWPLVAPYTQPADSAVLLANLNGPGFLGPPPWTDAHYPEIFPGLGGTEIQRSFQILHWLQRKLQRLWLIELDKLAAAEIKKIIDLERGVSPNSLLIFALPEFYFTYFSDLGRSYTKHGGGAAALATAAIAVARATPTPAKINDAEAALKAVVQNYSKPFYSQTLDVLFNGTDIAGINREESLRAQGQSPNVIILGGTARWKNIEVDHTTEIIFNSLPIFSIQCGLPPGTGPSIWTKIYTSGIDGYVGAKKVPSSTRVNTPPPALDPLRPAPYVMLPAPLFNYTHSSGRNVSIGLDICLDYSQQYMYAHSPSEWVMWTKTPHIHALIAAGMPVDPPNGVGKLPFASHAFIRCDGGGTAGKAPINGTGAFINASTWIATKWTSIADSEAKIDPATNSDWFKRYEFSIP